jgi:hypothetical protein
MRRIPTFYSALINRVQSATPDFPAFRTYKTVFSIIADDDVQFSFILKVNKHFPPPAFI